MKRARTLKIKRGFANLLLATVLLSFSTLYVDTGDDMVAAQGEKAEIFRSAQENSNGVSLMFNVYWGTDEVYQILEILADKSAKATFFIGGCWADDNVQCLRDIYAAGHEIGNHGYFHKDHSKLSQEGNEKEISSCNQFIQMAIGSTPTLFAPPSGAYGDETLRVCKKLDMKTVLWSRDTIDWRDKDASLIYQRATKNIRGGEFILMHPMQETVEALDDILDYYQEKSLFAVTVSQNLEYKMEG